jgi:hypothetical protein
VEQRCWLKFRGSLTNFNNQQNNFYLDDLSDMFLSVTVFSVLIVTLIDTFESYIPPLEFEFNLLFYAL